MDLATISAVLEIDVDPGIFDDWITGLEDPANVQTNDARDLCYALRISDGANIEKILASAVTLPAAAETASVTPTDASESSATDTASSSGSPTEPAPVDPAPAPDPASPTVVANPADVTIQA